MVPTPASLATIRLSFAVCAAAGGASAMEAASAILAPDATRPQQPAQPNIDPPHATPSRTTFPRRSVIPLCLLTRAARKSGSHFRGVCSHALHFRPEPFLATVILATVIGQNRPKLRRARQRKLWGNGIFCKKIGSGVLMQHQKN